MKSWMKSSKVLGGLISIIFFVILFSGLSSAGPIGSFDAGNSCFCKSEDLGVFGAILCNLEKTLYIFFNTSLQCHKEPPSSSTAGSFDGGEGGPSKAAAAGRESGDRDVGAECDNSGQCKGDLVCAIFTAKDMNLDNLKRDGLAPVLKVGDKDLKEGEYAYCAELSFGNLRVNKECRLDKECSSPPLTVINDNVYYCNTSKGICEETSVFELFCEPETLETEINETCVAIAPGGHKIELANMVCSNENKCIFQGAKMSGNKCLTNRECQTLLCKNNICIECAPNNPCGKDMFCKDGKCNPKKKVGNSCKNDTECLSGKCDKVCKCISSNDCENNTYCKNGDCTQKEIQEGKPSITPPSHATVYYTCNYTLNSPGVGPLVNTTEQPKHIFVPVCKKGQEHTVCNTLLLSIHKYGGTLTEGEIRIWFEDGEAARYDLKKGTQELNKITKRKDSQEIYCCWVETQEDKNEIKIFIICSQDCPKEKKEQPSESTPPSASQQAERKEVALQSTTEEEIKCELTIKDKIKYHIYSYSNGGVFYLLKEQTQTNEKTISFPTDKPPIVLDYTFSMPDKIISPQSLSITVTGFCTDGKRKKEINPAEKEKPFNLFMQAHLQLKKKILDTYREHVKFVDGFIDTIESPCAEINKQKATCGGFAISDSLEQNKPITFDDVLDKKLDLNIFILVLSQYTGAVTFEKNTIDSKSYDPKFESYLTFRIDNISLK